MFCTHCGKELDGNAVVCPGCGCPTDNGFKKLNDYELKNSFGVKHSRSVYGYKLKCPSYIVEVDSFRNSKAFIDVLGYINTAEKVQQKGADGEIK